MKGRLGLAVLLAVAALMLPFRPVAAAGPLSSCTEAALDAAVASGGAISLTCTGTITLTHTITVTQDTTLDGGSGVTVDGNNTVQLFSVPSGVHFTLSNITLAHGHSYLGGAILNDGILTLNHVTAHDNSTVYGYGGGVVLNHASLTVRNSTFTNNQATGGGAIDNEHGGGTASIVDSTFASNNAIRAGAIMNNGTLYLIRTAFIGNTARTGAAISSLDSGTPLLDIADSTFNSNTATYSAGAIDFSGHLTVRDSQFNGDTSAGDAGAICNCGVGGVAIITGSTFSHDQAQGNGGAVVGYDAPTTIDSSTFDTNSAGSKGGAIAVNNALTLIRDVLTHNVSNSDGGAVECNPGPLVIRDSTFEGDSGNQTGAIHLRGLFTITGSTFYDNSQTNGVEDGGGAIFLDSGEGSITNSTFSHNSSGNAGGSIFDFDGYMQLFSDTISGGIAGKEGGNLFLANFSGAGIVLRDTILAGGLGANGGGNCNQEKLPVSLGYNIEAGHDCKLFGLTDHSDVELSDLKLQPLNDNGGPTLTMALGKGSVAIDKGSSSDCPATDQRGATRPQSGSFLAPARCDIGAYEYGAAPVLTRIAPNAAPAGSPTLSVVVTGNDFLLGSTVQWNGNDLPTHYVTSTTLSVTIPASDLTSAGTAQVTVHNPGPGDGGSDPLTFTIGGVQYTTPPTTVAAITPPPNAAGWNNTHITITLIATDHSGHGIAATYYALNSAGCSPSNLGACQVYSGPIPIVVDGVDSITFFSIDNLGNAETPVSRLVRVDTTPPSIAFFGNAQTYTVDQTIAITCKAADYGSGVASSTCPSVNAPAYTLGLGTHTLTATATDVAGNTATADTSFTVIVTPTGLQALTRSLLTASNLTPAQRTAGGQIAQLTAIALQNVATALAAHNSATAQHWLQSYDLEITTARASGILTAAQANLLISLGTALLS